jgi:Protein of unknown function (DUF4058)
MSLFPGMDPYLEDNELWHGFHNSLAVGIKSQLNKVISPKYYADVELHSSGENLSIGARHVTYPDVGVYKPPSAPLPMPLFGDKGEKGGVRVLDAPIERVVVLPDRTKTRSVRIYVTKTHQLVTAIEILSPTNKQREGLEAYRRKRLKLLDSPVNLVELDLLRGGERPGQEVNQPPLDTDYILLINRENELGLRVSQIWPLSLSEPFPLLPIPLLYPDNEIALDLNQMVQIVYEESAYVWRIDYAQPVPPPKLRDSMAVWLKANLPQVSVS